MTMRRLPLFTWINFVNAFIILMALPVLNAGLAMLLIDRLLDGHFFLPQGGGHPFCGNTSSGPSVTRRFTSWSYPPSG